MSKISTETSVSKKNARLDYVQFDVECIDKPRFQTFLDLVEPIAGLFLFQVWLKLGRAENARIPRKYAASLCHSVRCPRDVAEKALDVAIAEKLLDVDGEFLTLERIEEDQQRVAGKRERWSRNKERTKEDSARIPRGTNAESERILNTETEHLNTEDLNNEDLKKETVITQGPAVVPRTGPPANLLDLAESKLQEPDSQQWSQESTFINTGRRPMRDYPNLHFTPTALAQILEVWIAAGIPGERFGEGFLAAEARAKDAVQRGRPPPNAEAWMLGFIKKDLMDSVAAESRMKRAREPRHATVTR